MCLLLYSWFPAPLSLPSRKTSNSEGLCLETIWTTWELLSLIRSLFFLSCNILAVPSERLCFRRCYLFLFECVVWRIFIGESRVSEISTHGGAADDEASVTRTRRRVLRPDGQALHPGQSAAGAYHRYVPFDAGHSTKVCAEGGFCWFPWKIGQL